MPRCSSTSDDQRLRLQPLIIGLDPNMPVAGIEIGHLGVRESRTKLLGLCVHVQDELGPIDSFWETRIVFNERSSRELSAGLATFQYQWAQIRAGRVNCRRQSSAAASNNDH